jgi:predicted transcriptional regulator
MTVLHVQVAEPMADMLDRARVVMETLEAGSEPPESYFGIGFESMSQVLAVFTPKRLALVAYLREHGPLTVAALARGLGRDYKSVHADVADLMEWTVVERGADGQVWVPWDEIDLRLPLARRAA